MVYLLRVPVVVTASLNLRGDVKIHGRALQLWRMAENVHVTIVVFHSSVEWVNVVASVIPHPVNQIAIVSLMNIVTMGHVLSVSLKTQAQATHQELEVSRLLDPIMDLVWKKG